MHAEAMAQMAYLLAAHAPRAGDALDVGAFDVNGNYRGLVTGHGLRYTGLDVCRGPNVDVVAPGLYAYPFEAGTFDVVLSGSTMEHVPDLWRWTAELARVLKPGGLLALITHTRWAYHPYPLDCWRVLPDGMRAVLDATGCMERYTIDMYCDTDISAIAWKAL